jgi:predicted SAM-dependent methyltransferase
MKIHLCCGDVYLRGYVNCDIEGVPVEEAMEEPPYRDLESYYSNRLVGHKQLTYLDQKFDITQFPWPFRDESVDELVMIQAIEHFDFAMAQKIVDEILRILVPGGKLLIDFPDLVEGVQKYAESDPEFMMRFVYCNHKNQYSIHHWGYTKETFPKLLGFGWTYEFREIVHHLYPAIGCEATKMQ